MRVNIVTEILLTMKYGMPSAKYNVGTHIHGLTLFLPALPMS